MSGAYYNEIDPYAAQWLRNLIAAGHIADGVVDERSICDVKPEDLHGFTQCHFFAGIGVWSHALRLAQWADTRAVWTGSCPCQPFSLAGKFAGVLDERHLWPHWFWLIEQCRPPVIFGEQVEAALNHGWLDLVHADLEGIDYAVGAAGVPAAGVGAPHIRQRLWFVANDDRRGLAQQRLAGVRRPELHDADGRSSAGDIGHANGWNASGEHGLQPTGDGSRELDNNNNNNPRLEGHGLCAAQRRCDGVRPTAGSTGASGPAGELANAEQHDPRRQAAATHHVRPQVDRSADRPGGRGGAPGIVADGEEHGRHEGWRPIEERPGLGDNGTHGFWSAADWIACRDGKSRPVEPGTFPLAHGATQRVGRLRAYGNAIVPQVAAQVIATFMEYQP